MSLFLLQSFEFFLNRMYLYMMFKLTNWNKTIPQHIDNFIRCENEEKNKEMVKLKKIMNNNDYCDFFKILTKKFIEFVQKNMEDEILFDYNSSVAS